MLTGPQIMRLMTDCINLAQSSLCADKQVGAMLVDSSGHIRVTAHNHPLTGARCDLCLTASRKNHIGYCPALHAEQALMIKALEQGLRARPINLISTLEPCGYCARLMGYLGVKDVYFLTKTNPTKSGAKFWHNVVKGTWNYVEHA